MAMQKLFLVLLLILSSNNISCNSSSFVSFKETSTYFPKYLGRSLKASQTTFNVISYGAKGDGATDDTKVC
jgi:polygalacturonase